MPVWFMREGSLSAPIRHPVDWQNPDFYDEGKLDAELRRVFDVCHGCRRCFNLCDSFPRLFDLIDATPSGELHDVTSADFKSVADACTLCDMCFMTKCPYVPPHPFNLDFPHLMLRYRALETKKGQVPLADRELTKIDRNGKLAHFLAPLVNGMTSLRNQLSRWLLERAAHVHREAVLPRYSGRTFIARAAQEPAIVNREAAAFGQRKAVIYATCSMNYNDPDLGMLTRAVLAKNGVETEVIYPSCCGMPQLEQGDIPQVVANARKISAALRPWIEKGYDIVALVPSCALMLKLEWPLLVPQDDPAFAAIKQLAAATFDLSEYIVDVAAKQGLAPGMQALPGPVALHLACHARAQNMGAKAAEMLQLLPQSDDVTVIERCSGHGGSWGIKRENFPVALKVGRPVARKTEEVLQAAAKKNRPGFVASECPLAAAHIVQGVERLGAEAPAIPPRAWHPVEIFALAYGIKRESA
jgi:Fe-S oxidoreductase